MDFKKTALVIIDVQENTMSNELKPNSSQKVIDNSNKIIDALGDKLGLIVLVNAGALSKDSKDWPRVNNDDDFKVSYDPDGLALRIKEPELDNVVHISKHNWGAFYGTSLDLHLRRRGINTIILTGVLTSLGVDTTAREAYSRDYNQIIISDAISDVDTTMHDMVLKKILPLISEIKSTEELLAIND